jgi:hypothetical protein
MQRDDVISLEAAASACGLPLDALRIAAEDGRLPVREVDGAWTTTLAEVDRFRREFAAELPQPDEPPPDEMDAEGPDGQVYGG